MKNDIFIYTSLQTLTWQNPGSQVMGHNALGE